MKKQFLDQCSVGAIARTLYKEKNWEWYDAYDAAYAFKWGVLSPRTLAQARADIEKARCVALSGFDVDAVAKAYRKVKPRRVTGLSRMQSSRRVA